MNKTVKGLLSILGIILTAFFVGYLVYTGIKL